MSLTIDLTTDELAQLKQLTRTHDVSDALSKAARAFIRMSKLQELKSVSGKVEFVDVSEQLESLELHETDFPK